MWFKSFFKTNEASKTIKRDFLMDSNEDNVYTKLKAVLPNKIKNDDVVFVCIGTDRSTGDSLGPLVGTYLKTIGYTNVYGTIDEPVHAQNIKGIVSTLPKNKKIIAIDSCLGGLSSIGKIDVIPGPLFPGRGAGKECPPVGDYAIVGVVNVSTDDYDMNCLILQGTRLSRVMNMAKEIVNGIVRAFPLWTEVHDVFTTKVDYDLLLAR